MKSPLGDLGAEEKFSLRLCARNKEFILYLYSELFSRKSVLLYAEHWLLIFLY
jgi:hypothetical protein